MQIGMIGLGRMGANMTRRLMRGGHDCVVHNQTPEPVHALAAEGAHAASSYADLVRQLQPPRAVWLMIPAGAVDAALASLTPLLARGDIVVDGGNSHYHDDIARARALEARGIHYVDCGTSGGVWGLERGYCLMIGGAKEAVERMQPIFATLAPGVAAAPPTPGRASGAGTSAKSTGANAAGIGASAADTRASAASRGTSAASTAEAGYLHCGPAGAGHFVKMVHNGIEYGVMAAYAEGFNLLRHANVGIEGRSVDAETSPLRHPEHFQYDFDLAAVAEVWRRGSVIASWLLDLTAAAFARSPDLAEFSGRVSDSGEGRWTVHAAVDAGVPAHVLSAALYERFASRDEAEFQNRVLSAMRHAFGGHLENKGGPS